VTRVASAFLLIAAAPSHGADAPPESEQLQILDRIGEALAGRLAPGAVAGYFSKDAVFVGQREYKWDLAGFANTLLGRDCDITRSRSWGAEEIVHFSREGAEAARARPSYAAGLSFYCVSGRRVAAHETYTFRFEGKKISKVYFASAVGVPPAPARPALPAPPAPPPPPNQAQLELERQAREASAMVLDHYRLLARHDPLEIARFYESVGAVPAVVEGQETTLSHFYSNFVSGAGRASVRGCFPEGFGQAFHVRCRLFVNREANPALSEATHFADYYMSEGKIRRVVVSANPSSAVTVSPHG
jgi:hypothetical protein